MNPHRSAVLSVIVMLTAPLSAVYAGPEEAKKPPPKAPAKISDVEAVLTVAVLDFEAKSPESPDLGKQISETVTAVLSGEPGFTLVDRAVLTRALQEQELNLTGLVDANQAVQVGKVVGARIMVTGRAFPLGQKMMITAKLIGTETSLVEALVVKDDLDADIGALVIKLAGALGERLRKAGPKLVACDSAVDPLPALKAKLKGRKLPVVAVVIPERHMNGRPTGVLDPAVETEVKRVLKQCGFVVMDVKQNELLDWTRAWAKNSKKPWPRGLAKVDVVIGGEGFSEFAARIGNLVSCTARAEVNLISRKEGKIVLADRTTVRAVDLSENIAGKKALQKAGRVLAVRILEHVAKGLPAKAPPAKDPG